MNVLSPLFSCSDLQMVMMFLQASFAGSRISGNAGVRAKQVINTYLEDALRTGNPRIGPNWVVVCRHKCRGHSHRVVTDFFAASMCVTDIYTCFSLGTHNDRFLRPLLLVTDFFVAHERAPDIHLGAFGSQTRYIIEQIIGSNLLLKPMLPAKVQTYAAP